MSRKSRPWAWKAGRLAGKVARGAGRVLRGERPTVERRDPQMAEWYANLELAYGADLAAVHKARKRLLARYHPDRFGDDPERARRAHELTLALNEAHQQLVKRLRR